MSIHKILIAAAVVLAAAPAAFADNGATLVGRFGYVSHPFKGSSLTRAEVEADLSEFLRDGGRLPSGDTGSYVPAKHEHTYVYDNGRRMHADHLSTMGGAAVQRAPVRFERLDPALYGAP